MLGGKGGWGVSSYPQRAAGGGAPPLWPRCEAWAPVPLYAGGRNRVPDRALSRPEVVQCKLVRLPCRVCSAATSPDPVFGDGEGLRLITHDISIGQFADIVWLKTRSPNPRPLLATNNRNGQARMQPGIAVAMLPQGCAIRWVLCACGNSRKSRPRGRSGRAISATCSG